MHFDETLPTVPADGVDALAGARQVEDSSLYFGLAGVAVSLHALGRARRGRSGAGPGPGSVRGQRWGQMFELLGGNAGIGLGALAAGDMDLAVTAVTPYLSAADRTRTASTGRSGRLRLVRTTSRTAHSASSTRSRPSGGPQTARTWSSWHWPARPTWSAATRRGPTGSWSRTPTHLTGPTSSSATASAGATVRQAMPRCSGCSPRSPETRRGPARRPVLAHGHRVRAAASGTPRLLGQQRAVLRHGRRAGPGLRPHRRTRRRLRLRGRARRRPRDQATVDDAGVRWSNHEHRADPPELEPRPGWAMGNAGIVRELLRYARLNEGGDGDYAIGWPDQAMAGYPNPRH